MRLSSVRDRESAINQIGRNKVNKWARSDSHFANLIANDKVALETTTTTTSAGLLPPRPLSESSRSIMESSAALSDQLRSKRAVPTLPKRALTEGERVDEAIRRRAYGLQRELEYRNDESDDDDHKDGGSSSKKFKKYYYEDVDERRYLVYDRTDAVKWGKESLFVRRMTNIDRLDKVMAGEGLRLEVDKFLEVLTGRMTEELLGIGKEDPTFVSNLELRRILCLPIMRDSTKFGKMVRGEHHSLGDFVVGGKIDDLTQMEQACQAIQHVFAAVFDLRWGQCMFSVLGVIRHAVMRQVTLKFILVRVEGAWRSFNRIVVGPDRYHKNPAEHTHPEELVRMESVIQLWTSLQGGLLEQCQNPVALIRWYAEFGGASGAGPSTVDEVDKVWSVGTPGKGGTSKKGDGAIVPGTPPSSAKREKSKERNAKKRETKKLAKEAAGNTKTKIATPGSTGNPAAKEYCLEAVKKLVGTSKTECMRPNCRFLHPTTRKDINGEDLKEQTKGSKITGFDEKTRRHLLNQLGVKVGAGE
jgi:hypothetical protein